MEGHWSCPCDDVVAMHWVSSVHAPRNILMGTGRRMEIIRAAPRDFWYDKMELKKHRPTPLTAGWADVSQASMEKWLS